MRLPEKEYATLDRKMKMKIESPQEGLAIVVVMGSNCFKPICISLMQKATNLCEHE